MSKALRKTPFYEFIAEQGAKFTPFAGYDMPVSFAGTLSEALHVRAPGKAGLFDVSHMGQLSISGANAVTEFKKVIPSGLREHDNNRFKYTVILNEKGGVIDDITVVKKEDDSLYVVVNASRKAIVLDYLRDMLSDKVNITLHEDKALLALQGEGAHNILSRYHPRLGAMRFGDSQICMIEGVKTRITRSGYTGEDGFELSFAASAAETIYDLLCNAKGVAPIGLAARDALRLEAGLCLYGNDLTEDITPIEANLGWLVSKRRIGEKTFAGAEVLEKQIENGPDKIRVGLAPQGKQPIRSGAELFDESDAKIGFVSSGGFSPTLNAPVCMGYVPPALSTLGTVLNADIRGKRLPLKVTALPFVPHRYKR